MSILPILPILPSFNLSSLLNSDILTEKLIGVKYFKRGRKKCKKKNPLPAFQQRFFCAFIID